MFVKFVGDDGSFAVYEAVTAVAGSRDDDGVPAVYLEFDDGTRVLEIDEGVDVEVMNDFGDVLFEIEFFSEPLDVEFTVDGEVAE